MAVAVEERRTMTLDAYMTWEAEQPTRNEFVGGEVVAMVGGTRAHDRVKLNATIALDRLVRGSGCFVGTSDTKVLCGNGNVRYPDLLVDCGSFVPTDTRAAEPRVVVEVLSKSTAATDFVLKMRDYASVSSIDTYLLLWQDEPRAVVNHRTGEGWRPEEVAGLDGIVELPAVGARLALAEVYAGLGFEPAEQPS